MEDDLRTVIACETCERYQEQIYDLTRKLRNQYSGQEAYILHTAIRDYVALQQEHQKEHISTQKFDLKET